MNATLNDLYPGASPAGTSVEVVSTSGPSVLIRVGRKTVKCSPRWLDFRPPTCPRRPLRTVRSVLDD